MRKLTEEQVLDLIDEWHEMEGLPSAAGHPSLHEFLGWTWQQYTCWVETGTIPFQNASN